MLVLGRVKGKEELTSSSGCHLQPLPHLFVCNSLLLHYSASYLWFPQQWSPHPSTLQMLWTGVRQWPNNLCKWKQMQNLFLPEHIFPYFFCVFREARVVRSLRFLEGHVRFRAIKTHFVPILLARSTASGDQPIRTEKSISAGARINWDSRTKSWQGNGIQEQEITEVNREPREKHVWSSEGTYKTRHERKSRDGRKPRELKMLTFSKIICRWCL